VELVLAAEDETAPAAAGAAADTPDDGGGGKGGLVREEDEGRGPWKKDPISEGSRFMRQACPNASHAPPTIRPVGKEWSKPTN